jgi:hypothetical protein
VCLNPSPCPIQPSPSPSLLIALSSARLGPDSGPVKPFAQGQVHWLPSSQSASISADGTTPAHLLRILLPASP